ncbi:TOMM precursor leader peptide-binding protein [Streptomyces sodiiphilus]|uniref:TOMM leader peptide-binding protein n=1 Tax=Streptomyces sodiiphilus TaxID=226217 RepID=A0ABN2P0W1_9ACTN
MLTLDAPAHAPERASAEVPGPVAGACREMAELTGRSLAALGRPERVTVAALGVRDAIADPGDRPADPAVPVWLYGRHAVLGPLPGRDEPPCPLCLERRWQLSRYESLRDAVERGAGTGAAGRPPWVTPFAADAVAAALAGWLAEDRPRPGVLLVDLAELTVRRYPLVPDPECPRCGGLGPDSADAAAIELRPAPVHRPGASRVRPLDDYDLPVAAYANPVCGVLGRSLVYDVSSTSTSATIGCFTERSGAGLVETFWGGHADSYRDSARIGVLEGLERYAGARPRARTTAVTGSLEQLRERGHTVLDPAVCGLYSEEFHRTYPKAQPFRADLEIPWVWGHSLRDDGPVLVPEILTYYQSGSLYRRFVQESSNGCASGGSVEEAVYFGLLEVIERDAFLLAWYGRARLPEIDPRTSTSPATVQMVDRLEMYGYEARFFDTRISFPVPVITGVAERFDGGPGRMCFGAGAGLDAESALASAMCEIATDSVNLPGRFAYDETRLRAMAADYRKVVQLHDHPMLYGVPEMGAHAEFLLGAPGAPRPPAHSMADRFGDGSVPQPTGDVREDLTACLEAVTAAGFDVIAVDQTVAEQRRMGLHTLSVLVPGLIPIDFGWSRQRARHMPRMFTALREAGLKDTDLTPGTLNPAPHPFP